MKKITLIPILVLLLTACKKDLQVVDLTDSAFIKTHELQVNAEEDITITGEKISGNPTEFGFVYNTMGTSPFLGTSQVLFAQDGASPNLFTHTLTAFYPDAEYTIRAYGVIDGQVYYGKTVRYKTAARGSWKRLNNFPGPARRFPISFTVNGKGYVGCGAGETGYLKDMWEYDPATDAWTQITDYPGEAMHSGFSFVIGNKAYVGGGGSHGGPPYNIYFGYITSFEFDPVTKNWTQLDDLPLGISGSPAMFGCFAFSVGGYGFVGGGSISLQQRNFGVFKFDPATKTWEGYSGGPKDYKNDALYTHYGTAFAIGNTAYVGTGFHESDFDEKLNYFFSWNYQTKEWTNKSPAPGPNVAFGISTVNSGVAYFGFGDPSNDIYQYNPANAGYGWRQVSKNPDYYGNKGGICFTIGNKTYVGLGEPVLPTLHEPNRIYEFTHTR